MRLHQGSLIFQKENGECPSWETALGQATKTDDDYPPYYFKAEGYGNLLEGMLYNSVPLAKISSVFGRKKIFVSAIDSFSNPENQEIQLAGKFDDIVVHYDGKKRTIRNNPIILLLTKTQDTEKSHFMRRSIKYSPHTKFDDAVINQDSFDKIQSYYEDRLMCYGFFVEHFDLLHLYCVKAGIHYEKKVWDELKLPATDWTDWVDWELKEKQKSKEILDSAVIESELEDKPKKNNHLYPPVQAIYYGVPGCGKSYAVDDEINKVISEYNKSNEGNKISYENQVARVVFHPDYGNADFVGQITPKTREDNRGVDYVFKAGPFSQILRKAYLNPSKPYFLVIEEINRGNAAAIFGDIFQSLDRLKDNETSFGDRIRNEVYEYTAGWSKYGVANEEINGYILDIKKNSEKDSDIVYDSDDPINAPEAAIKIPARGMHFSINSAIRLPPNLSIYATMNTSDQNVFTLDNAFQRRWEMKQVLNKLERAFPKDATEAQKEKLEAEVTQYNEYIGGAKEDGGTGVKWGEFRETINEIIMQSAEENGLSSMEDRRLGGWFIIPKKTDDKGFIISKKAFAEKVLKYLWDDAFKFDRKTHFGNVKTLEKLIENFDTENFNIFADADIKKLQEKASSAAHNDDSVDTSVNDSAQNDGNG